MRSGRVLVLAVLWAAVGACGGSQMRAEQAPSTSVTSEPAEESASDPRRAEIERLERQIDSQTGTVQPDAGAAGRSPGANPPGVTSQQGQQGQDAAPACADVCQASSSICRAAARICSLADDMDDDWAHRRCRRASRTCTNVRRRSTDACGTC